MAHRTILTDRPDPRHAGWARASVETWHGFLEDFVDAPDIIARVKDQPLR